MNSPLVPNEIQSATAAVPSRHSSFPRNLRLSPVSPVEVLPLGWISEQTPEPRFLVRNLRHSLDLLSQLLGHGAAHHNHRPRSLPRLF